MRNLSARRTNASPNWRLKRSASKMSKTPLQMRRNAPSRRRKTSSRLRANGSPKRSWPTKKPQRRVWLR